MSKKIKKETVYRVNHVPGDEIDVDQDFDYIHSINEYDENGNLLLEIAYSQDGEIADKIAYRYDESNLLMETTVFGEDDEILERKEAIWSEDKKLQKEITHYMDGSSDTQSYIYSDAGILSGFEVKDDEDEMEYKEIYRYDNKKVTKVERYNGNDELIFSQDDHYEGDIIRERKIWSAEEEEPFTVAVSFNDKGRREQELRYNNAGQLIERNLYETDNNDHVIRIVEENRQAKNTTEFEYDEAGNVVHQLATDLHGDLSHEVFRQYDKEGQLLLTTVEAATRPGGPVRAYSLVFKREYF